MARKPADLLQNAVHISSLPTVYTRINDAVNNPRGSIGDVATIISSDPGLTSRLLQLVNSAFFGFPSKIDTVSRACVILGNHQLRDLALATSVMRLFKNIPADLVNMESFWRHSIACGMAAKILADAANTHSSEHFFVAGMLHDLGRLVIFQQASDEAQQVLLACAEQNCLAYDKEKEILGFTHAAMAAELFMRWKLPPALQDAAAFHHQPMRAERYPMEAAIVHVADIIVHGLEFGSSGERFVPPLNEKAWERLELTPKVLTTVIDKLEEQYAELARTMLPGAGG